MRDDFSKSTKDILAKRVGFRCSNPNCRKLTSGPNSDANKSINIGVAAHIVPASEGFVRDDPSISSEERKSIDNGIWLCQACAKLIDSDEQRYSVDLLHKWKTWSEEATLLEIENHDKKILESDVEIIKFYAQCFDRPVFQDRFKQEGSLGDFDQAINDIILALNTGVLKDRKGVVLKRSKGKSYISNNGWRKQLHVIVDLLRAIRERYAFAKQKKEIHISGNMYCINNHELSEWFDRTRIEVLKLFESLCTEAGINLKFNFPRKRRYWD